MMLSVWRGFEKLISTMADARAYSSLWGVGGEGGMQHSIGNSSSKKVAKIIPSPVEEMTPNWFKSGQVQLRLLKNLLGYTPGHR